MFYPARVRLAVIVASLALVAAASAELPQEGTFVPGRSLGGVRLGMTATDVKRVWGERFGRCRNCGHTTWYFTHTPFEPQGAGVELRRGRVVAVFTLWSPSWHTNRDLWIGEPSARITKLYGALPRTTCGAYSALTMPGKRATTSFYVSDEKVWGFGLSAPGVSVCR